MNKNSYSTKIRILTALLVGLLGFCNWWTTADAQVNVTATAGTTGPTSYPYLSTALAAVNAGTHQGDIVIEISASITDTGVSRLISSGAGSASYTSMIIRPSADGVTLSYASAQGFGVIELNGADSVTIDGDNPSTPGINRDLTIVNTASATTTFASVIRVSSSTAAFYASANGIYLKNLNLNGNAVGRNLSTATSTTGSENASFGVIVGPNGGPTTTAVSSVSTAIATGVTVNNFNVTNCAINQCARGVSFLGAATTSSTGVTVSNNLIGDQVTVPATYPYSSPANTVYAKAILIQGTTAATVQNNSIKNIMSYVAILTTGVELNTSIGAGGVNISNNNISNVVVNVAGAASARGISLASTAGTYTINANTVSKIENSCNSTTSANRPLGIYVTTAATSGVISNNMVSGVVDRNNGTYGAAGMFLAGGNNVTINNNMIRDINQDITGGAAFSVQYGVQGLLITSGTGHKVYHNSIHLSGALLGTAATSVLTTAFAISTASVTGADVRNNVFSNVMTGGSTSIAHVAIYLPSGASSSFNLTLNNNAYFTGTNVAQHGIAQAGATAGTGFYLPANFNPLATSPATNFRTYSNTLRTTSGNDSFSFGKSTAAPFVSATDLHAIPAIKSLFESSGATLPGFTTDIDGDVRPGPAGSVNGGALAPDLGADEADMIPDLYSIDSTVVEQLTGVIAPGATGQGILRIKVYQGGSVSALKVLNSLKLSTTGSTNAGDIINANVYYTGSNATFSTTTAFGTTVASPNGTFYATGTQTLVPGVNYLWLTYDVGASIGNVVDATLDSLQISGTNYSPLNGDPSGSRLISGPMTYVSSTTTQTVLSKVGQGTTNNRIIGIQIVTSAIGTPINLTQLDMNANGTTDTAAISNIKVWYTGNSSTFATTTQFGTTLPYLPGISGNDFSVTGTQALANGTNYLWLTYDVKPAAVIGTLIDAELINSVIDASSHAPSVSAPAGTREVRAEYCAPAYGNACSSGDQIVSFSTTGGSTNISNLNSGCNGNPQNYIYYNTTGLTIPQGSAFGFTVVPPSGAFLDQGFKIWIDYNQDGVYDNTTELVFTAGTGSVPVTSSVTVPCSALTGTTRMRVRSAYGAAPGTPCSSETYGETEDYNITILASPAVFAFATTIQQTGTVAQSATDRTVLRVPVRINGCGDAIATAFRFSTTGTTNTGDIVTAKLYSTGNSTFFNTSKLVGTVSSPSGQFTFMVTDTMLNNDTTNYWLTYDLSGGASLGNAIDATFDSVEVLSGWHVPSVSNPAGNVLVDMPMTYISSTTTQNSTSSVAVGAANTQVIGVQVVTSPTGSPISFTSLDIATNGTTSLTDITNLKVWYTGNSNVFATTVQFGSTVAAPAATETITGTQSLSNGTNYFWVTYDVAPSAVLGNFIDAECTSITAGSVYTPSVTAPAGNRKIRAEYCVPVYSGSAFACADGAYLNNVSTTGGLTNISNLSSGCPGGGMYTFNSSQVLTVPQNGTFTLNLSDAFGGNAMGVWIDYNQDGVFGTSELVFVETTGAGTASTSITIPCSAASGTTRMRVRTSIYYIPNDPCVDLDEGEGEDYTVEIVPAPVLYVSGTTIQQTGLAAPGITDRPILRIPVKSNGCAVGTATEFYFNTAGTSNNGDITFAKLYSTGNSAVFNTSKLVGSVMSPSGSFNFMVTDTIVSNDTTNYWLAYDVNGGATAGNTLDATFDSLFVIGAYHVPSVTAPAGNVTINNPMTYTGADAILASPARVGRGTANNAVIAVRVIMSSTGAPVNLTQLDFSANGTTDTANIRNMKVWYTGNNASFSPVLQFGSTLSYLPGTLTFTVNGSQSLLNDTNYFWLSYDVVAGSTIGNKIDAEVMLMTIAGVPSAPSVTAPAGDREIREEYCTPVHSGYSPCISNVTLNTLNSSLGGACGLPAYTNFPTTAATTSVARNTTYNLSVTTDGSAIISVWLDLNGNGIFEVSEWQQVATASTGGVASTIPVLIPCNAALGEMRMRIRARGAFNTNGSTEFCSSFGSGESEDYTITVLDNPAMADYSAAIQEAGTVSQNVQDRTIMRIPVHAKGCGVAETQTFYFNTASSTNATNDIANAKLYVTGNSPVFNTSKLIGSAFAPNGVFTFSVTDTLLVNDTTNYWLAYDVTMGATIGDILDARLDSIATSGGVTLIPVSVNPSNNIVVDVPMTYLSSTVTQNNVTKVGAGSANNDVVRLEIVTSATGSGIPLNSIDISTNGTTSLTDITNLKVWYTGNSSTFATTTQYGSTVATPAATQTITGSLSLLNGNNYFWVTYDVASGATLGNVVDAEVTSISISAMAQTPSVTAPAGDREIRAEYCSTSYTNGTTDGDYIGYVELEGISNTTTGAAAPYYTYYSALNTNLVAGRYYTITLGAGTYTNNGMAAWIDFNNDGIFSADEKLGETTGLGASPATTSFRFAVPLNASLGITRLRVREIYNVTGMLPCAGYSYGETEDYNVTITPAPAATVYTWNQTGTASYLIGSNFTPVRTYASLSDKFVFNGGGTVTVTDVLAEKISSITVANNTTVMFAADPTSTTFGTTDSLNLVSGKLVLDIAQPLTVGKDTVDVGVVTGAGRVEGTLSRWVNAITTNYDFPLGVGANNRNVTIAYTTAPVTSGKLTASFIVGAPGDNGLPLTEGAITVNKAGINGVWRVLAGDGLAGGAYTGTFTAQEFTNVLSYGDLVLLKRNNSGAAWVLDGTHVTTTGTNNMPVLSRTGMSGFSEFGIGGDSMVNPLPVKLLVFTANNHKGDVVLDWATSTEINNKGFEVQRSVDGKSFDYAGFVKGAGNSAVQLQYTLTDRKAFAATGVQTLYYRLKQLDANGTYSYSKTVSVTSEQKLVDAVSAYPNPFNQSFTVSVQSASVSEGTIQVFDLQGKLINSQVMTLKAGVTTTEVTALNELPVGVYLVKVVCNNEVHTLKMIKTIE